MPNIKSAEKRVKVTAAKTLQNKMGKSYLKTVIKKYNATCEKGNKEAAATDMKTAVKAVDQAVSDHIIHKNTAARKKSAMALKYNKLA